MAHINKTVTNLKVTNDLILSGNGTTVTSPPSGLTSSASEIGTYSSALALGDVSEHYILNSVHVSATVDDGSNIIGALSRLTTSGDSATSNGTIFQGVYGRCDVDYNLADGYGVRGHIDISGDPEVQQMFGVFGTLATTACTINTSGNIAALAAEVSGSADIAQGGTYGKLSGMYIAWKQSGVTSVDTCGIYLGVHSGSALDDAIRVNTEAATTNIINNNTPSNVTNFLSVNAAGGYLSTSGGLKDSDSSDIKCDGYIKLNVGSTAYYIPLYDTTT